jgi:hypothetical protein
MRHHHDLVQQALQLLTHPIKTSEAKEALQSRQGIEHDPATKDGTIQAGATITWTKAGVVQTGVVDFMHIDEVGAVWAFVTLPDGRWAAINTKVATVIP